MKSLLFPGQGAQKEGMGQDLFSSYPNMVEEACEILKCRIDKICLNNDNGLLNKAEYTQPALFLVEALAYKRFVSEFGLPDMCAGHSLGEYAALYASGAISFSDGLNLTQIRGRIMGQVHGGKMAAVVGVPEDTIINILHEANLADKITLANFNTQTQTVISGKFEDLLSAEKLFENIRRSHFVMLDVSGAFHSKYMLSAAEEFNHELKKIEFMAPKMPIISNVDAKPYDENVYGKLSRHMTSPVFWKQTLQYMIECEAELISMEPHGPMPGMIRAIIKENK